MHVKTTAKIISADFAFNKISFAAAFLVLILVSGLLLELIIGSELALSQLGFSFITSTEWNPVLRDFGALPAIFGTLVSSLIAIVIAIPVAIGSAIFLNELTPKWFSVPVGKAIELLAAIPSIIYGMWGLFVFAPWFADGFQMWAMMNLVDVPVIGVLFDGPPIGIGLLTAGIILSFMILPIMIALTRDALASIPNVVREAGYGLGATSNEVILKILLPKIRSAVVAASLLGTGRALGETMAVAFVIGGSNSIQASLFMPASSISATIAQQFNEASDPTHISALIGLGLVLLAITFVIIALSRLLLGKK
ncbi:phosphate ABC transporter permease subunit PstC [Vibrio agarivorans]|uniref:phosphate ABC transporter permease subunit PstC n=1 Tax=Vibrio agarivorans TaxID=153622 RepID=UPI002230850F|nr:phosphate ABC transporter permease subunit PstC [Vibrio agarivorans]MDN3659771.1 phosphate ABC transporter permease subunit PstC [Vibrio agarivorans]